MDSKEKKFYEIEICNDKTTRCSKEVLEIYEINHQTLVYNHQSEYTIIAFLSLMLAFMFGLGSTILDPNADMYYFWDLWSVAHFFTGVGLVFLLMIISLKPINNTIYVSIFLILYEGIEEIMRINNFIVTFSSEIWYNVVGDIIADLLGTFLAYYIIHKIVGKKI